nr:MAG TPA_asm: hypothetical protein [Caudoviricetes sp.]DAL53278.1 MAG TPA_asm: hypothetical protein [Caudoviricetes sp.]DAW20909.1 MAG TPA: hypothetical protein [Caudoviricetes sp.]
MPPTKVTPEITKTNEHPMGAINGPGILTPKIEAITWNIFI